MLIRKHTAVNSRCRVLKPVLLTIGFLLSRRDEFNIDGLNQSCRCKTVVETRKLYLHPIEARQNNLQFRQQTFHLHLPLG